MGRSSRPDSAMPPSKIYSLSWSNLLEKLQTLSMKKWIPIQFLFTKTT